MSSNSTNSNQPGNAQPQQELDVDSIIQRLLEVRGSRPGRQVQLAEHEIRGLCLKAREIFMSQPILLELEAPIKICGMLIFISNISSFNPFLRIVYF